MKYKLDGAISSIESWQTINKLPAEITVMKYKLDDAISCIETLQTVYKQTAVRDYSNSPLSHGGHIVPGDQKSFCFTTLSLAPTVLTARLCVVKQSFFGLPGQYGRRVTKANEVQIRWRN